MMLLSLDNRVIVADNTDGNCCSNLSDDIDIIYLANISYGLHV